MDDMEFTREEKIALLKDSVAICSRNIMILSMSINRNNHDLDKGLINNNIKKSKLEKQAFELLLHKIEKGEVK